MNTKKLDHALFFSMTLDFLETYLVHTFRTILQD